MNFFDATLKPDVDNLIIDTGAFMLKVPANKAAPFRSHSGKDVILGVRPEDIHDSQYLPSGITPANITSNVEVIEQMGNEMIIYLEISGKNFIARTDPRTDAQVGGTLDVTLNLDNMHIFDKDTEVSLAYEAKNGAKA